MRIKFAFISILCVFLTGCVDQNPEIEVTETIEEPRIIATSYATMEILEALNLDIVARVETTGELSAEFLSLPTVGTAMAPDAEAIVMLEPTDIIGPDTLIDSIKPTYDVAGIEGTFIDLQSVHGLYESIEMLGEKYDRQEQADDLINDYNDTLDAFSESIKGKESPRVLVLMGLPGSYIASTNNSYVGSLISLAGATNVVQVDTVENYVNWNTEELIALEPDIILLTAHGLPEQAMDMFNEEFQTNDIWKNFSAVEEGKVYSLDYEIFGMSATFEWKKSLEVLKEILYDETYESFINEVES